MLGLKSVKGLTCLFGPLLCITRIMKVLVVLHIATLKGSGKRDQFQQVNDRINWMKSQDLFSFFTVFSSGLQGVKQLLRRMTGQ